MEFELPGEAFQIVDAEGRSVVEPGEFEICVGPSSRDGDLLKATLRVE
jgi:beta-glucosidase